MSKPAELNRSVDGSSGRHESQLQSVALRALVERHQQLHTRGVDEGQAAQIEDQALGALDALEREVAFSSYAVPTILGEIKRYFRDRTWSVRVPRDLQELALRVDRAVSDLSLDLHRQPTVEEIATKVGVEEEEVLEALEASGAYKATSLEAPRGNEDDAGDTLGDTLGTEERGFSLAEDRATIEHLMRSITPREREVLRLRFEEDLTQAEIGELIGVSQMQVSRIIRQALERIRLAAAVRGSDGSPRESEG